MWLIRDLDSKNGVRVNGSRVNNHALSAGDVVRIGDAVFVAVAAPADTDLSFRQLAPDLFGGHLHASALAETRGLAREPVSVVLEGATGTGKERFASQLHEHSGRPGPLVAVNCGVYGQNNAAAELFGYKRGAFTGASEASAGHIRSAEGGTLFLDEVAELPPDVQPMLLRVLENRQVMPLGEVRPRAVDVRFVAAVQRPLSELVAEGRFRADLRARIEQAVIRLPRLAQCREIIAEALLARVKSHGGADVALNAGFVERLSLHDFPLNFRELDVMARKLAARRSEQPLAADELIPDADGRAGESRSLETEPPRGQVPGRDSKPYSDDELAALRNALQAARGNVAQAASVLGLSRTRVYRMLKFLEGNEE